MLTEYDYYTGMIFRGYTYGTGDAVVKGGRYDHLIGQFGKDAASVGFAVVLDELMLALSRQKIDIPTNEEATMVLYEPEYRSTAIRTANALRNSNIFFKTIFRNQLTQFFNLIQRFECLNIARHASSFSDNIS